MRLVDVLIKSATVAAHSPIPAVLTESCTASLLAVRYTAPPNMAKAAHTTTSSGKTFKPILRKLISTLRNYIRLQ